MKNAFLKDFFRDIRKSSTRFGGIFAIVALGVAVFAGLGSTGLVMQNQGHDYFSAQQFMDIRVLSTFGLSSGDIDALKQVKGVETVQPAHALDVLLWQGDEGVNLKLHSVGIGDQAYSQLNRPLLLSGRYPQRNNEILVEAGFLTHYNYRLGDELVFESGKGHHLLTQLKTNRFKIVGTAQSPLYFFATRGSSSIGDGVTDYFALVPEAVFLSPIYSEAYLKISGADTYYTFNSDYKDYLVPYVKSLESLGETQVLKRREEITGGAFSRLAQGERKIDLSKEAGHASFKAGDQSLNESSSALSQGKGELARGELDALSSWAILNTNRHQLEAGTAKLDAALLQLGVLENQLAAARVEIQQAETALFLGEEDLVLGKKEALGFSTTLYSGQSQLEEGILTLDQGLLTLSLTQTQLEKENQALTSSLLLVTNQMTALEALITQSGTSPLLETQLLELNTELSLLEQELLQVHEEITDSTSAQSALETELQALEAQLNETYKGEADLLYAFRKLRLGRQELNLSKGELEAKSFQLERSQRLLISAKADLILQRSSLQNSLLQLEDLRLEWQNAQGTLAENRQSFSLSERDLALGLEGLERKRTATLQQLEASEKEIVDLRQALYKVETPKWYVLDREGNQGYVLFKDDAEKIHAIGQTIPLLFFLVAALVSLTTMTRLVEEQRTHMGTLKSLGYTSGQIMLKYLLSGFVPTILGSLVGGFIGLYIFHSIVLGIYQNMYNLPPYTLTLNFFYWTLGSLLGVFSTSITTFFACRKELAQVPATLMGQKPPTAGGKTLLEHVTFFWSRLSFSYKITFRNIFRYKKRLFMTLLGVGGCTALLVVGYGMQDSIQGIGQHQYEDILLYDMTVSFTEDAPKASLNRVSRNISLHPIGQSTLPLYTQSVDVEKGSLREEGVTLSLIDQPKELEAFVHLREPKTENIVPLPTEGAVITEKLGKILNLSVGDSLTLTHPDHGQREIRVAAIVQYYVSHGIYMNSDYYKELFTSDPSFNTLYVNLIPTATTEEKNDLSKTLLEEKNVTAIATSYSLLKEINDIINSLDSVVLLIISAAGLLVFVVLFNLTNINITERRREIATIEVLGFYEKEVYAYIYRENRIVSSVAALIGLALGKLLHSYIMTTVEPNNIMFGREIKPLSYLYSFVITMVFVLLVDQFTKKKIRDINMVEALKSLE